MRNLIFILVPVVLAAYVINKYVLTNVAHQWIVYFIGEGIVSVTTGTLLVWFFHKTGRKIHTLAAVWYLIIALFALVSEIIGERQIGGISEPIWIGLCVISTIHIIWSFLKKKNQPTA